MSTSDKPTLSLGRVPHSFAFFVFANVWARAARRLRLNVDAMRKTHSSQNAR